MNYHRLQYLLSRYAKRDIEKAELQELLEMIDADRPEFIDNALDELIAEYLDIDDTAEDFNLEVTLRKIQSRLAGDDYVDSEDRVAIKRKKHAIWWVAAVAVGALLLFTVLLTRQQSDDAQNQSMVSKGDILLPNQTEVRLSLNDGTTYNVMETDKSILAQKGIEMMEDESGEMLFVATETDSESGFKTFTNPKGGIAKLRLVDGTTVLLNSGASITYPSAFASAERRVEIAGELFFEVAHDKTKPFVVAAGNTNIKVLGTVFNVAVSPEGEGTHTTLMKGSVEVATTKNVAVLVPGKQAVVDQQGGIRVEEAQIRDVLAWKNGYFSFNDYDIDEVMEQLGRWYEIEDIRITGRTNDLFSGSITRTYRLSEVLKQLEKISNYKFSIEGRRIVVMK